jgi:NAD(P)-dependent dehydrogenase (short-subunit alcohol dehydrogenase family)
MDRFDLVNRAALVTGGGGLLSLQHSNAILKKNGILILVDINKKNLIANVNELKKKYDRKIYSYICDITNEKEVVKLKNKLFKLKILPEILINNAAIDYKPKKKIKKTQSKTRLEFFDINQLKKEINVGLIGAVICSKVFGFEMAKKKRGVILNIGSDLSFISPDQNLYKVKNTKESHQPVKPVSYSIIKHGILGLTKYTANYWIKKNVRCNMLAPGGIFNNQPKNFINKIKKIIPIGRMAKKDEYEDAILFLISDASSYMNGSSLIIDGGRISL